MGLLDWIIGWDWMGLDYWIGLDWMGLLDWIIGWFFFTQTLTWPGPQGHISQGRFFCFFTSYCQKLSQLVKKSHFWTRCFEQMMIFGQI